MVGRNDSGVNFDLFSTKSGNGKSESAATKVYMPWAIPAAPITTHYKVSNLGGKDSVNGGIIFDLSLEDDNRDDLELFVAVKKDSETNYKVVAQLSESTPFVSLSQICGQPNELDCTALDANSFGNNVSDDAFLYVFYVDEDENYNLGTEFDPSDSAVNNGLYFKVYFSNRLSIYNSTTTKVTSQTVGRGDKTLYVKFEGSIGDAVVNRTGIFGGKSSAAPTQDNFFEIYNSAKESAELSVTNLENDVEYCFLARYIDQYGFMSLTSELIGDNCESPIKIEQLLNEKSCFLVTAGFQRDHYVLDYFRAFRDNVLINYSFGKKFIKFYYSLAPSYAKYIYSNVYLAKTVRGISYLIYYVMRNFLVLVFLAITMAILFYFSKAYIWQKKS